MKQDKSNVINLLNKVKYKYKSDSLTNQKMFITIVLTIKTVAVIRMVVSMKITELIITIIVIIIIKQIITTIITTRGHEVPGWHPAEDCRVSWPGWDL